MLPSEARSSQEQLPALEQPGTICGVGSVLLFPNSSVQNVAVIGAGLRVGLRALSLCTWVSTPAPYLGTLLSYATEDNDNKLVVHGWDRGLPGSMHFVIGDPEFRELPVTQLLDGKWHHLCLTWSSEQGKFRFYVDRRLLAGGPRPGGVAILATGQGLPPGALLTLANASLQGWVRRVECACLERCL
ncbi:PREDICTED: pentraxin-4 [Tinamus guttatus]|uniref:pentraxin-4 n=1 Tax=Tinamus guttatus TaxID=94827 RepID=UPI00052ECDA6|nr:PREDICTED: pentraxin-4 [Tinamus guttatus]